MHFRQAQSQSQLQLQSQSKSLSQSMSHSRRSVTQKNIPSTLAYIQHSFLPHHHTQSSTFLVVSSTSCTTPSSFLPQNPHPRHHPQTTGSRFSHLRRRQRHSIECQLNNAPSTTTTTNSSFSPPPPPPSGKDTVIRFDTFDSQRIRTYYNQNPTQVLFRIAHLGLPLMFWSVRAASVFSFAYLSKSKVPDDTMVRYASQLRSILTNMGPTFVKIGQALSNRPDILPPAALLEFQKLQDNVDCFDTQIAFDLIERELGVGAISEKKVFRDISKEPIAAASLGQVYKAILTANGQAVAIKVQRPGLAADAAIDYYILRKFASIFQSLLSFLQTDLVGIIDEFGYNLYQELDYLKEAENCKKFASLYGDIEGIKIPKVYTKYTSKVVLVQEWIQGTRQPWGADSLRLLNVGIKCTLRQLLEEGFFHADPHSGNLLRTEDGCLAYLDFGMMNQVLPAQRYDLILSLVHMINSDYDLLAQDFVNLGFLPNDIDLEPIIPVLRNAMELATEGKGASNLNFAKLTSSMANVAFSSPIKLPPYYIHVIRTLGIMEGIALAADKDFKIIDEAYPYVASRLLTDDAPELRQAMRQLLFDPKTGRLQWERFGTMLGENGSASGDMSDEIVTKLAQMVMSSKGNAVRELMVGELIETVDSFQLAMASFASVLSGGLLRRPRDAPDVERLDQAKEITEIILKKVLSPREHMNRAININRQLLRRPGTVDQLRSLSPLMDPTRPLWAALEAGKTARSVLGELTDRNMTRAWESFLDLVDNDTRGTSKDTKKPNRHNTRSLPSKNQDDKEKGKDRK